MTALIAMTALGADPLPKAVPTPQALFNFDKDALGKPPPRFTLAITGEGPAVHWEVKQDRQAPSLPNVLAQTGAAKPGENFALALLEGIVLAHGEVAVRFKALSGEEDQAAGIVWRYQNPQTYYVVRANAKEDNCSVFRVKKGKRKEIDTQAAIVTPLTWHELRLSFVKENFTVSLDGELVLGGKDKSFRTPGQVGLWTKADSVILFDDFRVSQ